MSNFPEEIQTSLSFGLGDVIMQFACANIFAKEFHTKKIIFVFSSKKMYNINSNQIDTIYNNYHCNFKIEKIQDKKYHDAFFPLKNNYFMTGGIWKNRLDIAYPRVLDLFINLPSDIEKLYPYKVLKPKISSDDHGYICCWHTKNNLYPVLNWKNPIGDDNIIKFAESLKLPVKYIDYAMNTKDVIDTVRHAKICIGYEGIGQYVSQTFMKPLITFSKKPSLSKYTGGPWSMVTNKVSSSMFDIDKIVNEQQEKIDDYRSRSY